MMEYADNLVRYSDLPKIFENSKFTKAITNQTASFTILECEHRKGEFALSFFLSPTGASGLTYVTNEKGDVTYSFSVATTGIIVII